jgi:hypothetical protein
VSSVSYYLKIRGYEIPIATRVPVIVGVPDNAVAVRLMVYVPVLGAVQ